MTNSLATPVPVHVQPPATDTIASHDPLVSFLVPSYNIRLKDCQAHYEWSLLDTHDSTTDVYKHMRTPRQIEQLLGSLGALDIVVKTGGNGVEAFCRKPC